MSRSSMHHTMRPYSLNGVYYDSTAYEFILYILQNFKVFRKDKGDKGKKFECIRNLALCYLFFMLLNINIAMDTQVYTNKREQERSEALLYAL